jgi:hypothetical protein
MDTERNKKIKKFINACGNWSIPFIVVGPTIMIIGLVISFIFRDFSIGNNMMGLGIATFTLGVAFLSIKIADESDEKMKAIANADFIEIAQKFLVYSFDCQIKDNDDIKSYHNRIDIINWHIELRKADILRKWVTENRQGAFGIALQKLLKNFPWKNKLVTDDDVKNLLDMYEDALDFQLLDEKDILAILEPHFGKKQDDENYHDFIERVVKKPKTKRKTPKKKTIP